MRPMSFRTLFFALLCIAWAPLPAPALTFVANLDGPSESPPNASPGSGFVTVTIDSGAHTLFLDVDFANLTSGNTAAHIHVINGPGDTNTSDTLGPVATTTPTFAGFPSGVTSGSYTNTLDTTQAGTYRAGWITDSGGTTSAAEAELFEGIAEGRAYFNIHTDTFPGGEIRGFLQLVPEPATAPLLGVGLAGLLAMRRRQKAR
jgi:CHRD domain-containing protein/PEP-CTERM motif-containing protein